MNKVFYIIMIVLTVLSCDKTRPENNISLFDNIFNELWETVDKNYAFFNLRDVDWKKEKELYLNKSHLISNDSILFLNLCELLKNFDDSHINLESSEDQMFCNAGKLPEFYNEFPTNESFGKFLMARDRSLSKVGISEVKNSKSNLFQYGKSQNNKWGYIRFKRFYGESLINLTPELNKINGSVRNVENLILDIRTNPGGNDETALLCAGYFFENEEIAFIKMKRSGNVHTAFGEKDTTYIIPSPEVLKKSENIFLLTNGASGSSADVFALIMSYLPNVKIVGRNTEGIFSNMYRDTLSNGWTLSLSNEKYFSKDMNCFEKIGVPVDIIVDNKMEDVLKGKDKVIEEVLKL